MPEKRLPVGWFALPSTRRLLAGLSLLAGLLLCWGGFGLLSAPELKTALVLSITLYLGSISLQRNPSSQTKSGSSRPHGRIIFFPDLEHAKQNVAIAYLILLNILAVFSPFFVSDDALRHIHDGYYLLRGVDVYLTAPEELLPLSQLGERLPNHPELGSIYLPSTQLMAVSGSLLSVRYGFLALFHSLAALFMIIFIKNAVHLMRRRLLIFLLSPWFVFILFGHHADVLGLAIVLALLSLLRRKNRHSFEGVFFGASAAFLVGLKPEGFIWFFFLSCIYFFRSAKKDRQMLVLGILGTLLVLGAFSGLVLWKSRTSLAEGLFRTIEIFANWFVAYNPWPDLASFLFSMKQKQALRAWRLLIFLLFSCVFLFILFRKFWMTRRPALSGTPSFYGRVDPGISLLTLGLFGSILAKGVWHPWYFSWTMPLLLLKRRPPRFGHYALFALLALAYLPVIELRLNGTWEMREFYWAFGIGLVGIFILDRSPALSRRTSGRRESA